MNRFWKKNRKYKWYPIERNILFRMRRVVLAVAYFSACPRFLLSSYSEGNHDHDFCSCCCIVLPLFLLHNYCGTAFDLLGLEFSISMHQTTTNVHPERIHMLGSLIFLSFSIHFSRKNTHKQRNQRTKSRLVREENVCSEKVQLSRMRTVCGALWARTHMTNDITDNNCNLYLLPIYINC